MMNLRTKTAVLTMLCCLPFIRVATIAYADEEVITASTLEPPLSQKHAEYLSLTTKMAIARVATAQIYIEKKDYLFDVMIFLKPMSEPAPKEKK